MANTLTLNRALSRALVRLATDMLSWLRRRQARQRGPTLPTAADLSAHLKRDIGLGVEWSDV